ncbi:hypothetical protein [Parabacteroides goldsteinii]|uniref:hypothetical protein n=1 Tax=Parabacteroides goldsteinii TaxID=328812 RepID=UPI0018A087E6|nr:hypothetical protein [Parabacteroides goldsteinii]
MYKMIIYPSDDIIAVAYTDAGRFVARLEGNQYRGIGKVLSDLRRSQSLPVDTPVNVLVINCCRNLVHRYIVTLDCWNIIR